MTKLNIIFATIGTLYAWLRRDSVPTWKLKMPSSVFDWFVYTNIYPIFFFLEIKDYMYYAEKDKTVFKSTCIMIGNNQELIQ